MRPKTAICFAEAEPYKEDDEFSPNNDIFYTSEVNVGETGDGKFINEFKVMKTIGQGAYSKVKLVSRMFMD